MSAKAHERRHGEGSITEAAPGIWRAWRPPDAENRRISKRFTSREAANRWLVGEPDPIVLYVGPYLERWLGLRAPTLRGRTPQTYAQFLGYAGEGAAITAIPLAELSTDDCQAWINELLKAHTRGSVDVARTVVSAALNDAVRRQLIPANPTHGTRLPSREERPLKAWTRAEVARLLSAAEGTSQAVWFAFALATGLRLGELRALEPADLDLARMAVRVSKSLDNNSGERGPTKSGRGRTVDVPDELRPRLVEHVARLAPGARYLFGKGGLVPYRPSTYRGWLRRICVRAGVHDAEAKTLPVHAIRHTFASLALGDPDCSISDVANALGHATITTTLSIYAHFVNHDRRATASALGRVLAASAGELHRDLHREGAATR